MLVAGRAHGELLKTNLATLKRGASEASLSGYDSQGNTIASTVPLDPKLTPKENMERYFLQARKGERGVQLAASRIATLERELAALAVIEQRMAAVPDAELEAFVALPDIAAILAPARQGSGAKGQSEDAGPFASLPRAIRPRTYTSIEGWEILVGRDARANDHLTTRIANGLDWFFHLADAPGSHVILRNKKDQTPPLETMLDCGQLALHFSTKRDSLRADVHYARCKHVRKPKGAKPGLVYLNDFKTLTIKRDEVRLARLLARP